MTFCPRAMAPILLLGTLAGCAVAPSAPGSLHVPMTQKLIMQLHARGVQIYECQPANGNPAQFEWAFKQPEAVLFSRSGRRFGRHYGGPIWEANDGSKVGGELLAKANSAKPNSVPQLLLRAKNASARGAFAGVTYVQRLNTEGGVVPTAACRTDQAGQQLRAAYSADYLFYAARR